MVEFVCLCREMSWIGGLYGVLVLALLFIKSQFAIIKGEIRTANSFMFFSLSLRQMLLNLFLIMLIFNGLII